MFKMPFKLSICLFLAFAHYLSAKQLLCGNNTPVLGHLVMLVADYEGAANDITACF